MTLLERRSFLFGLGALIAAPAIVRATNIMPVKQMLILPDRIGDITFDIEGKGTVYWMGSSGFHILDSKGVCPVPPAYSHGVWSGDHVMADVTERWERMKKREAEPRFATQERFSS
jgi:hypothetical protein